MNGIEEEKDSHDVESIPVNNQYLLRGRNNQVYQANVNIDIEQSMSNFSQSTPSEMSQVMMSSDEVRDIMNMYSVSIENCHTEIDFYSQRVNDLTKNRNRILDQNAYLRKEQDSMAADILNNKKEIETLEAKLAKTKENYNELSNNKDVKLAQKLIENIEKSSDKWSTGEGDDKRSIALKKFKDMVEKLQKTREIISRLEEENETLNAQEVLQEYKEKMCIICKRMQIPKFNHDEACYYHPGLLRFFSCRGCGGDEYYNCCQKCKKCSVGCRVGKHYFDLKINTI